VLSAVVVLLLLLLLQQQETASLSWQWMMMISPLTSAQVDSR
jgi:hypothetical protein